MNFRIEQHSGMESYPNAISLPTALRLDLGALVGQQLQIRAGGEALLLEIVEQLHPEQELALVHSNVLSKIKQNEVELTIPDVTLGCDPEFFILWQNKRVSAATYLPFAGQIGCDGELGELRPTYGRHESHVVGTLGKLIPKIPDKLQRAPWAHGFPAGGHQFQYEAHSYWMNIAAGFHVHLGIPPEILNTRKDFNRASMNHIVRCLDWYVSVPLVPLETSHGRRLGKSNYGKPGDYRPANVTLEYRTPGAFYLRSPKMAAGLLGLSLLVTENIIARLKVASRNFVNLHKLTSADLQGVMPIPSPNHILGTLTHPDVREAQRELGGIRRQLEALPTYGKHSQSVEEFFRAVEEQERPDPNLLMNWKETTA